MVRGYLSGSGWKQYTKTPGHLWGHQLPIRLSESERLPNPIYTPSSKATEGHDLPLTIDEAVSHSSGFAVAVEAAALDIYAFAAETVDPLGLILADTQCVFGVPPDGALLLCVVALTPESSRCWLGVRAIGNEPVPASVQILP